MGLLRYLPGAIGAVCWGLLGVFFTLLDRIGYSTMSVLSAGLLISAVVTLLYMAITAPKKLIPNKPLMFYAVIIGIVGIVVLNLAYLEALRLTSVPIAVLLISTAPFFVLLINFIFYRHKPGVLDFGAIVIAVIGIALGMNILQGVLFSITGLLWGLLSGACFGIYIVLGTKAAGEGVDNLALLTYTFILGAIILNIIYPSVSLMKGEWSHMALFYLFLWVAIANLGGWFFYNWGLGLLPSHHSGLISVFEPISGLLGALIILGEHLSSVQIFGILLAISAIGAVIWSNSKRESVF